MQLQAYSRLQPLLTPSRTEQLPAGTAVRILDKQHTRMQVGGGDCMDFSVAVAGEHSSHPSCRWGAGRSAVGHCRTPHSA